MNTTTQDFNKLFYPGTNPNKKFKPDPTKRTSDVGRLLEEINGLKNTITVMRQAQQFQDHVVLTAIRHVLPCVRPRTEAERQGFLWLESVKAELEARASVSILDQ